MSRTTRTKAYRVVALTAAVLLALNLFSPSIGLEPPLGLAGGIQNQRNPTACEAVGLNWTNCDDAFVSDDVYAYANETGVASTWYVRDSSSTVSVCDVNKELLDTAGTGPVISQNLNLGAIYCYYTSTLSVTIPSGDWTALVELSLSGGGSSPQARITVDITDSSGTVQETVADCTTGNNPSGEVSCSATGVAAKTLSNQRLRLRVEKTTGTRILQLRYDGPAGGDGDSRVNIPRSGGNDTAWRNFGFSLNATDAVERVEVGVEWFRNSTAPVLNVTVSWDGGTSWATNQTAANKSSDDNTVEWLDFTAATSWDSTTLDDANFRARAWTNESGGRLDYITVRVDFNRTPVISNFRIENNVGQSQAGAQLDVDVDYVFLFNVTDEDGWSDIGGDGNVSLRLWYDGNATPELTFGEQTTGANYRIVLKYQDASDPSTASLGEWSVTEGRATYNASASSLTAITNGYEFNLSLRLGFQVKQANDPTNGSTGSFNDKNSWNAEIAANDGSSTATLQTASSGEHMEFGVFMYTFVNISGDWTVTVGPGQTANTNTVTVYRRSNDDFILKIWFTTDLTNGSDIVPIANVQILAAADPGDNITVDTAFTGLGESNATFILGTASWYFTHSTGSDEDTTAVQFSVTIPMGTAPGLYTAQLTIKLVQRPA